MAGNEVAERPQGPAQMVMAYKDSFAAVLPSHLSTDAFVRLAQGVLRRNQDLAAVAARNPASFMSAIMEAARLGHEPGTDHFALTYRGGEIIGIEQYQGVIERMHRAGAVTAVHAHVVRANDAFQWEPTSGRPPVHRADWFASEEARGALVGVYAYATLDNGTTSKVVVMGRDEVMRHRAVAATKKVWDAWEASMWLKTAVHELEKWVPTSAEYRREKARTDAVVAQTGLPTPTPAWIPDEPPTAVSDAPSAPGVIDADPEEWPEPREVPS